MIERERKIAVCMHDLDFSYGSGKVLSNINLDIFTLDSICIVGPNGGGKSTLVKLIAGLLTPDRGSVRVFGRSPEDSYLQIAYVPQYARYDPQFPISVFEVVCMGRLGKSFTGRYTKADKLRAMETLELVALADIASSSFASISGGQRQRTLIARALCSGGDILILDEPTANIDHEFELQFFDLLSTLNKTMTILMVTHEVGFASTFFKRIACVNKQVVIHPTSELTGNLIRDLYGGDLQMIRHDHCCVVEDHCHD